MGPAALYYFTIIRADGTKHNGVFIYRGKGITGNNNNINSLIVFRDLY